MVEVMTTAEAVVVVMEMAVDSVEVVAVAIVEEVVMVAAVEVVVEIVLVAVAIVKVEAVVAADMEEVEVDAIEVAPCDKVIVIEIVRDLINYLLI